MKGANFRKVICLLSFISAIACTAVGVIIWILVAKPNCASAPPPGTPSNTISQHVVLKHLVIDTSTGEFHLGMDGSANALNGMLYDMPMQVSDTISNCSSSVDKICLKNTNGFQIEVTTFSLSDDVQCQRVEQSYPLESSHDNITTCFNYGDSHWYGAAEVHDQHWPIEKWSIDLQEYITRDPYFPGFYGSVQERYWLSSAGIGIHAPFDIPLWVSMNASNSHQMCFVSKLKNSVYHDIGQVSLNLTFDVCTADNLTALHTAMANEFWAKPSTHPNIQAMVKPIWSTWAIYKKDINETTLNEYADNILQYNLSISQLELDDDWTPHYGDWIFDETKFPNAQAAMQALRKKVPAITLWIHPFVNVDASAFQYTADNKMLMNNKLDYPGLVKWWNPGFAGLLDFSNNETTAWFLEKLENLRQNYSIDSFKFDAGETVWMPLETDLSIPYFHPSEYIRYYVNMTVMADQDKRRQEVRVGCLTQDAPVLVRMLDRRSRWGIENGMRTLIPTAVTFGLIGYPFVLPDMIGGNAYGGAIVEPELYVRWLQINAFLPAIQFSIPPWYFNDSAIIGHTKEILALRESYASLFNELAQESVREGWPMVRPLWWVDPTNKDCQSIDDQFLLGNDLLVAPVVEKGAVSRDIYLPSGTWIDKLNNDTVLEGGKWLTDYHAALYQLPYFLRHGSQ